MRAKPFYLTRPNLYNFGVQVQIQSISNIKALYELSCRSKRSLTKAWLIPFILLDHSKYQNIKRPNCLNGFRYVGRPESNYLNNLSNFDYNTLPLHPKLNGHSFLLILNKYSRFGFTVYGRACSKKEKSLGK